MKSKNEIMSEAMREVARQFARKFIAMTADLDTLDQVLSMLPDDFRETIVAETINALHVSRRARTFECVSSSRTIYKAPELMLKMSSCGKRRYTVRGSGENTLDTDDVWRALSYCEAVRSIRNALNGTRTYRPETTYKMIVT